MLNIDITVKTVMYGIFHSVPKIYMNSTGQLFVLQQKYGTRCKMVINQCDTSADTVLKQTVNHQRRFRTEDRKKKNRNSTHGLA